MAKFCQNCGAPLEDGVKFCTSCGSAVAPAPAPAQPTQAQPQQPQYQQPQQQYQQPAPQQQYQQQPQYQQPQQNARPQNAPQAKPAKKKGKGGAIVAVILCLAAIGAVCFFGFRDGGFFRGGGDETKSVNTDEPTIVYDVKTVETLLDYAKKLEEAGNLDAAAAVYELIAKGGGADYIDEAHRDFPLVSAADEVEEFKGLFEKKGGFGK